MIDHDDYHAQSLESWRERASDWEARHDWMIENTGAINDRMVELAEPRPGQAFLDIAAGPGDLGFQIAERVGPEGRVISSDFAPEMVDLARRFGAARGLTNVDHRVLDAQKIELPDASVDGVVCRFGYMLMADPGAALRESRRVLRDGGSLTFAVWTTPDRNPWATVPVMTLVQRGHVPPPEPGVPGIFAMGDPQRIRDLLGAAGFAEPAIEEITFDFRYADFDDVWDATVRPLARVVDALPDDERDATRGAIKASLEPFLNHDGAYRVPAAVWAVHVR